MYFTRLLGLRLEPTEDPRGAAQGRGGGDRGEQRVTPAMADCRGGPWADPGKVVLTVEKAGQG